MLMLYEANLIPLCVIIINFSAKLKIEFLVLIALVCFLLLKISVLSLNISSFNQKFVAAKITQPGFELVY